MQKRIEFIDLAKGICILEIVCGHCGLSLTLPGCMNLRMPLYFILSGIFFKTYGGFSDFARRKTNKILVPFLFFYLIAYVAFYVANIIAPDLVKTDASGILDVFTRRQYFNGPIWFLICLFCTNIYFYLIQKLINNDIWKSAVVVLIGGAGAMLGKFKIFLPCMMDAAMTALPFFYIGYMLKRTKLLVPNHYDRYNLLLAAILWCISYCMEHLCNIGYISLHYNRYQGNFILDVIAAVCSVLAVLFLCKTIKSLPLISYCGRYSIILLCTHHLYYRPLFVFFNRTIPDFSIYATAIATLGLCLLSIPLCKKYIPMACAQKEVIKST